MEETPKKVRHTERVAKTIDCTKTLRFTYDRNSAEFQDTLTSYKECIYARGTEDDVMCQVAHHVLEYDPKGLIEGVGYLSINDQVQGQPFSGINWETDGETFDFSVSDDLPY